MNYKYGGLYNLLNQDKNAKDYFVSLPDYVQGTLQQNIDKISSLQSLKDFSAKVINK